MKEKTYDEIIQDFADAWNNLDAELIIRNLDESFVYDSMWVLESRPYEVYVPYIREKFENIRRTGSKVVATLLPHPYYGQRLRLVQDDKNVAFYYIKVRNGKVYKGDLTGF